MQEPRVLTPFQCRSVPSWRRWLGIAATGCAAVAGAQAPVVPKSDRAPEFRLAGDRVVLPIVMVRDYPFVEGEIAGVKGKLMLDTGQDQALAIDDHRVPLRGGLQIGTGHYGLGESFPIRLNAAVPDVRIGGLRFARATQVQSQDARQLERITPDFIGWIGYYFWQGYALKLDYQRLRATFYRGPEADYLAGEKVVGVIPFDLGKLPNHPLVRVRVGGVDMTAAFDTGQYGMMFVAAATKAALTANGALRPAAKGDGYDLASIDMAGKHLPGVDHLDVATSPLPVADTIGITSRDVLTIGYGFLHQYKTVWDYRSRRIYLLAR